MITKKELFDVILSIAAIALSFTFLLKSETVSFFSVFVFALATVGIAFILHEAAHKVVALAYHCRATFRAEKLMLAFGIFTAWAFGFIFIVPGAVHISNVKSQKEFGLIALAGPVTNAVLAFLGAVFFFATGSAFFSYMWYINAWLALMNMIPVQGFDGEKILSWNKFAFGSAAAVSVVLFIAYILV